MPGKSIGDFYLTSSNQRLVTPDNKWYEVSGVEPDLELQVFNKEDIFESHKTAVRKLSNMIGK
jgi:C-terminal processing protease CtpA/Prc